MRGQFQVITIAVGLIAIEFVHILMVNSHFLPPMLDSQVLSLVLSRQLMRLVFTLILACFLIAGASWARWFTIITTGLGGLFLLFTLTKLKNLPAESKTDIVVLGCWFMFMSIFYFSSSFILLTSSEVESYFRR